MNTGKTPDSLERPDSDTLGEALRESARLKAELARQAAELEQARQERDAARQDLETLQGSRSWQLTRPLRGATDTARKARQAVQLLRQAMRRGGGLAPALRKLMDIARREGLQGLRQRLRQAPAPGHAGAQEERWFPIAGFLTGVRRDPGGLLAPRVLMIAELSSAACNKYRIEQKAEMLGLLGAESQALPWTDPAACLRALSTATAVIFYRVPAVPHVQQLIEEAERLRLPVYWETDDLIFDAQALSQSATLRKLGADIHRQIVDNAPLHRQAMLRCGRGIASTEGLADAMREAGLKDVLIVENALDRSTLDTAQAVIGQRPDANDASGSDDSITLVYGSGSNTHNADFALVAPVLDTLFQAYPGLRFRLIGELELPPGFDKWAHRIERIALCSYAEYLAHLGGADIAIAPLEASVFNDAKSNIKFLEAAIVQLPAACSPRRAFTRVIEHGVNGFLCDTPQAWEESLRALIDSAALRRRIGLAARDTVHAHYTPAQIATQQLARLLPAPADASAPAAPRRLRVLSANIYYSPRSFGGSTIIAEEMNRRLQADGFEMAMFATLPTDDVPAYALRRYEADGVCVFGAGMPADPTPLEMFENPGMPAPFEQAARAFRPDLVHFHCVQDIGILPMEYCAREGIPFIVTLHDAWWLCGRQFMVNREGRYCGQHAIDLDICARCVDDAPLNAYRNQRLHAVLKQARLLLTPSAYFADFYRANGFPAEQVRVNRNGIRRPGVVPRAPQRVPTFGYVGGNAAIKGVNSVINALRGLPADRARLVVVDNTINLGFSSYAPDRFKDLANVEIVPAYTQASIDAFFADIDVLLFPTQAKESFGLVVREALARKVWVICSDAGGVVEDIVDGENGYIIPMDDDGTALKQAILQTLQRFSEHGGAAPTPAATRITWFEDQAAELAGIYREAAAPAH